MKLPREILDSAKSHADVYEAIVRDCAKVVRENSTDGYGYLPYAADAILTRYGLTEKKGE